MSYSSWEGGGGIAVDQHTKVEGVYVEYDKKFTDGWGYTRTWQSSDTCGQIYVIKLLLTVSIKFFGSFPEKFLYALMFFTAIVPSTRTFFCHQQQYFHGGEY